MTNQRCPKCGQTLFTMGNIMAFAMVEKFIKESILKACKDKVYCVTCQKEYKNLKCQNG